MTQELELGWCQGYMGLFYHMQEAIAESQVSLGEAIANPPYAIFSKKYVHEMAQLDRTKTHDFCFMGSMDSASESPINEYRKNRDWVIHFAKQYFTEKSVFVNTDRSQKWQLLGDYDLSAKNLGFCPKKQKNERGEEMPYRIVSENLFYFTTMSQSKYMLCPAGDAAWSFRFYEILMCGSIPVVESWHHTYRTVEESKLPYKYLLLSEFRELDDETYQQWVTENTALFRKYHMINETI